MSDSEYESDSDSSVEELSCTMQCAKVTETKPVKPKKFGSREQVWAGECEMTTGRLRKEDLFEDRGKVKSKRSSANAKAKAQNGDVFKKNTSVKTAVAKIETKIAEPEPVKKGRKPKVVVQELPPPPPPARKTRAKKATV
jgi:hypothetical protein